MARIKDDNKWHHHTIVYKKGKVWYYIDGVKSEVTVEWWQKKKRKKKAVSR